MTYCMDASALISLGERHYPEALPVFKPIWEHLYQGIDDGSIMSVDFVKIELERKAADWRAKFLSRSAGMFHMNEAIELSFASVIGAIESDARFRANSHRDRFMRGADPWLIAMAKTIDNGVVVSGEAKSLTHYGLGEICSVLGVAHLSLIEFFEKEKIGSQEIL